MILQILHLAAFVILPIDLFGKSLQWPVSILEANGKTPWLVRTVEASILAILASVMVIHVASGGMGMATPPVQDFIIRERVVICAIMTAIAVCLILLGFWKSISLAAAGMIISLSIGMFFVSSALSYERFEKQILKIPVPVDFTIQEQIDDIDILINGVRMGKAPLHTTIEELEAKAPPITVADDESRKGWKTFGNSTYPPKAKIRIDQADRVVIRAHEENKSEPMTLYVELERHGKPVTIAWIPGRSMPSRMFGQIRPANIPISVMTEEWHRDTTTLLEKARLMDYRVDAEWISAADTYFHFIRNTLIAAIPKEPQFQQVLTDWAKSRYHLDQVTDADSAWSAFESIQAQVDQEGSYQTNSITGDAVEYLVERLDSDRVIAIAKAKLKRLSTIMTAGFGYGWGSDHGKPCFSTSFQSPQAERKPSDFVLAHVIWRLDEKWDSESNDHDNAIEREIVPELIRLSYLDSQAEKLATILGGSALDEFIRRRQRQVHSFKKSDDPSKNESIENQPISRDFWQLVNAVGPAGARFRKENTHEALELAEHLLDKSLSLTSLPTWTDFLFLEVEGGKPLAHDFWNSFRDKVEADKNDRPWALGVLWSYLAKIRPLPTASEFVAVFPKQSPSYGDFGNPERALSLLPVDLRLQVVRDCIAVAVKGKSMLQPNTEPYIAFNQIESQFVRLTIPSIPSDAAADLTMSYLEKSNPKSAAVSEQLKLPVKYGQLTKQLLARLATSPDPEHRRWVIPQIRTLPDATNREILTRLLKDEDPSVRETAEKVAAELEELRRLPCPKLK